MSCRMIAWAALAATCTSLSPTLGPGPCRGQEPRGGSPRSAESATRRDGTLDLSQLWSQGRAVGKGTVRFTHAPLRPEDTQSIVPCGLMVGGHVCPIDHGYFFPKKPSGGRTDVDVLAPAEGFIVLVSHRTQLTGSTERAREYDDYALTIEHSGTFYTVYDLLTKLDRVILDRLEPATRERLTGKAMGPPVQVRIPVKAGQVIGQVAGRSLDFSVINTEVRLPGFLSPAMYGHYAWRVHVVDPFDYFDEPLRGELLKLNVRQVKPYFGKIDYDIDGRAVGNWFREGSGGYPGNRRDKRGYWMGHLALAYHAIDPAQVIVSLGDFDGRPRQFAVAGNAPDPASVSAKDGVVKYELHYPPLNNRGERTELPRDLRGAQGVLLVQLLEERKLRVEAFPGKTAAEVKGFTKEARTYER